MSDDGKIKTAFPLLQTREREDTAHGSEFLTREATYDTRLAEQGLNSRVAGGNGTRMTAGCTTARLRRTCLDSSNATALLDERCGMIEQLIRIGNIFDIEQLHQRVALGIKMFVHILQYSFNAILLTISDTPYAIKLKTLAHSALKDKDRCSTRA